MSEIKFAIPSWRKETRPYLFLKRIIPLWYITCTQFRAKKLDRDRPSTFHKIRSKICVRICNWHVQVPRLIQGQGEDRVRLLRILDTWNRANLVSSTGVQLMPSADFQNYYSTASAPAVFVFVLTLSSLPSLTYFPSPYFFYRASLAPSNHSFFPP